MQADYKITMELHPSQSSITLMLNGKLSEGALAELQNSISAARQAKQRVYIDLSEVTLVDRKTVEYFSKQAGKDVQLVNCPLYLRQWIIQEVDEEHEKMDEN
jgi:ABC-type transporter Mla MlaB component